jgi:hypothetical protein
MSNAYLFKFVVDGRYMLVYLTEHERSNHHGVAVMFD